MEEFIIAQLDTHARVVVADPRPTILTMVREILDAEDGIDVVATAGDLEWAARVAAEEDANVLIVDLHMLEGSSRRMIRELRTRLPGTSIVVLTMEATPAFVPAVMGAGACAYVLKEFAESDLPEAVRKAAIGHRFVSQKVAA